MNLNTTAPRPESPPAPPGWRRSIALFVIWLLLGALRSLLRVLGGALPAAANAGPGLERRVAAHAAELRPALGESRHLATLQLVLRTIPEHLWVKDRDGRYLLVSEALAAFHGYRPEEMIGRTVDVLYPREAAAAINEGDRIARQGQTNYSERLVTSVAGETRWFGSHRAPVYDDGGALIGLIGLARDITPRKEAELALARQLRYAEAMASCSRILIDQNASEDEYRSTLARALEILRVAVEADRIAVYYYPSWRQSISRIGNKIRLIGAVEAPGLPPQRPPSQEAVDDFPDELRSLLLAGRCYNGPTAGHFPHNPAFEQYQAENGIRSVVFQPISVGGRIWGHISVNDHTRERAWDDGAVQLLRTAAEVIVSFTQGWESRQALASSEAGLRALSDALPDLLFVVNDHGRYLRYHAPSPERLYAPPEDFLNKTMAEVLPPDVAALLTTATAEARRSGKMRIVEYELASLDDPRVFEARLVPIDDAEILCVVRDISEARRAADAMLRAKEAAEAADRAKSAFLATMSHEIRTPLNAVLGVAGLLRETPLSPEQCAYVGMIQTGGTALLEVLTHVLDFSRIESGYLEFDAQPFDLRACVADACSIVALEAERKNLALTRAFAPDLPASVVGDVVRLRQVLINLLANAVKFTDRGTVSIDASARPAADGRCELTLTVRDTGPGIPPDQIERIFEAFVQADSAITRRHGGTGLGLAISRQLVERMGGRIRVESTPGAGSTFIVAVALPVVGAGAPPQEPAESHLAAATLSVLIAEDNTINQLVTARLLARLGHQAEVAENGRVAVELIRRRHYDMVLMDLEMPEMDGFEAALRIRQLGDAIDQPYIIALTAHMIDDDRERYAQAGIDDYLSKPLHLDELRRALAFFRPPSTLRSTRDQPHG